MVAGLLPSVRVISTLSPLASCCTDVTSLSFLLMVAKPRAIVLSGLSVSSDRLCSES